MGFNHSKRGRLFIGMLLVLTAGCASRGVRATSTAIASSQPAPALASQVITLSKSTNGAPIEMTLFEGNSAASGILIIGGIHGNEPTSSDVARALLKEITEHPELRTGRTVAILPAANPDGLAKSTRTNGNGVDVNRNFPARNFRKRPRHDIYFGGEVPASEPETQAILAALERVKPAVVISIHSIEDGRECDNYDGPAEPIAKLMSKHNGYKVTSSMGYPTPGSLGSYAGIDRKIAVITLELPRKASGAEAWRANREALLAAISGE